MISDRKYSGLFVVLAVLPVSLIGSIGCNPLESSSQEQAMSQSSVPSVGKATVAQLEGEQCETAKELFETARYPREEIARAELLQKLAERETNEPSSIACELDWDRGLTTCNAYIFVKKDKDIFERRGQSRLSQADACKAAQESLQRVVDEKEYITKGTMSKLKSWTNGGRDDHHCIFKYERQKKCL
jgi:hypothetical protein